MRVNVFIASQTGLSRRAADQAIAQNRVTLNSQLIKPGQRLTEGDVVGLDNQKFTYKIQSNNYTTILLNKPTGYVCSREGQGSRTIYELLAEDLYKLKSVGRLDKDSSGLLLLTDDGQLANHLTHPRYQKTKIYEVRLDKKLSPTDLSAITKRGVQLEDGLSKFELSSPGSGDFEWKITMREGRNRQIRRSFGALGYTVRRLKRTQFGDYGLDNISSGKYKILPK